MCPEDEFIELLTEQFSLLDIPAGRVVELDLGCGKGTFTTLLAKARPHSLVLAADVMLGRLRKLRKRNVREGVRNMRLLRVEGAFLLGRALPDACLSRVHLLCPDPWPKARHRGHRIVTSEFAGMLRRVLIPGGVFHFSSDHPDYFAHAAAVLDAAPFAIRDDAACDDAVAIAKTDFETRWTGMGLDVRHAAWRMAPGGAAAG